MFDICVTLNAETLTVSQLVSHILRIRMSSHRGRVDFDLSFVEFAGVFISQQHNLMIHQSILSPVIRSFEGTEVLIRCFVCCSRLGLRFDGEFEDQSLRIV